MVSHSTKKRCRCLYVLIKFNDPDGRKEQKQVYLIFLVYLTTKNSWVSLSGLTSVNEVGGSAATTDACTSSLTTTETISGEPDGSKLS